MVDYYTGVGADAKKVEDMDGVTLENNFTHGIATDDFMFSQYWDLVGLKALKEKSVALDVKFQEYNNQFIQDR